MIARLCLYVCLISAVATFAAGAKAYAGNSGKPSPDEVLRMLKDGNERFYSEKSEHPHADAARLEAAGTQNQGDHAYATVITCSDSRVPVELIFDAGAMDIFVIRTAGNVCGANEIGSIEYGLAHVKTPVFVMLGHTQCGAVTAATHAAEGTGHPLERNIQPLVEQILPAVKKAKEARPYIQGEAIVPLAIEENMWQGIENLFRASPTVRDLVRAGKAKAVAAVYDVGTGKVHWLPEQQVNAILEKVEASEPEGTEPSADREEESHEDEADEDKGDEDESH